MTGKYDLILAAEETFARAVALGVRIRRPLSAWHFLIPGMFLFDFLKTSSEVKEYSKVFLFPRKQALKAAQDVENGEDRQKRLAQVEETTKAWLTSLKLYSERLHRGQMAEINLLVDHYSRLFEAEENSYQALVKNAYKTREQYESYLSQLTAAEKEIDRVLAERLGEAKEVWERLLAEQAQVEGLRKKEVKETFTETSR